MAQSSELVLSDGSTYKYPGEFYDVNRQVNIQTGTIEVQASFPNPDNFLRPGLYAKVRAATEVRHNALLVPQNAVLETQGQYQVAAVGSDNKVTMRTVEHRQAGSGLQDYREGSLVRRTRHHRRIAEGSRRDGSQFAPGSRPAGTGQHIRTRRGAQPSPGTTSGSQS